MQPTAEALADQARAIAEEVRVARFRRRMHQEDVALLIGITQGPYARREKGEVAFTGPELVLLAIAFDVDVAEFFPDGTKVASRAVA